MNIKNIVKRQYIDNVNAVRAQVVDLQTPSEGWIRTIRKALGMSGAQLGRRLNVTRATISQSEKAELSGSITIKKLKEVAAAMDCRLVYSFVPEANIEEIIRQRAYQKATDHYNTAGMHMALEDQSLSALKRKGDIERLAAEYEVNSELWND